jgi:DNA-formamidopyrimidine glycosylase
MPESPELAYSRDRLKQLVEGRALTDLIVGSTGRYAKKAPEGLEVFLREKEIKGSPRVKEVATKGKFMWWRFNFPCDSEDWYMHCTYGMSGSWNTYLTKHSAFSVTYNDSGVPITRDTRSLFFNDPRHFGTIKFVKGSALHEKKLKTLGPCILTDDVTPEIFAQNVLKKPARTIAEALMDQSVVSGVGNYLRAEILFDCGVDPWRNVTEITSKEYVKLCEATVRIAKSSYKSHGASIKTYRNVDGSAGTTQFDFKAYGCKVCPSGHEIARRQDGNGRMMHWCPQCQK